MLSDPDDDPQGHFNGVMIGTLFLIAVAYGLGYLLSAPPLSHFAFNPNHIAIGIIATLPLALGLAWFSVTSFQPIAELRQSQIDFMETLGFKLTLPRIVLLALAAGVSEELLFRGVLQSWALYYVSLPVAIIGVNVIFGALHMRTILYAFIAGLVGVYLSVLFAATGNLLTPIVTHALYDFIAFEYARRLLAHKRAAEH